jgi:hypothetical protein
MHFSTLHRETALKVTLIGHSAANISQPLATLSLLDKRNQLSQQRHNVDCSTHTECYSKVTTVAPSFAFVCAITVINMWPQRVQSRG